MSDSFVSPWNVAHQASLSMGFSKQKYWSGLPFPSLGDLPDPGIKLGSPVLQTDSLSSEPPGKPPSWHQQKRESHTEGNSKDSADYCCRRERQGEEIVREYGMDKYTLTAVFKTDKQHSPTAWHRELCSVLWGSLDGRGVWGRKDPCICMAESLQCSPETVTNC